MPTRPRSRCVGIRFCLIRMRTTIRPLLEAYAAKFGGAERTKQMLAQTQSAAQAEGLPMDFGKGQVKVSTLLAQRLMWLAGQYGVQEQVGEALFARISPKAAIWLIRRC